MENEKKLKKNPLSLQLDPNLFDRASDEEKAQMYAWLTEARELAIDAEGSKQKHEVFNKYKGRVNNYLSKRGYDLNKEREAWFKRLKEREKSKEGKGQ